MGKITKINDFKLRQLTGILFIGMSLCAIMYYYFGAYFLNEDFFYFFYNILLFCTGMYFLINKNFKIKYSSKNFKFLKIMGIIMIINGLYIMYIYSSTITF